MAPILCFTAEELWQTLAGRGDADAFESSVHLEEFPEPYQLPADNQLLADWDRLLAVREEVLKALEIVRASGSIGNALEARVTLEAPADLTPLLRRYADSLHTLFIVSRVGLGRVESPTHESSKINGLRVGIDRAAGDKCERCWNVTEDVGSDSRFTSLCARCSRAVRTILESRGEGA